MLSLNEFFIRDWDCSSHDQRAIQRGLVSCLPLWRSLESTTHREATTLPGAVIGMLGYTKLGTYAYRVRESPSLWRMCKCRSQDDCAIITVLQWNKHTSSHAEEKAYFCHTRYLSLTGIFRAIWTTTLDQERNLEASTIKFRAAFAGTAMPIGFGICCRVSARRADT